MAIPGDHGHLDAHNYWLQWIKDVEDGKIVVGPAGPQGPEGPRGNEGSKGEEGPQGPKGDKGDQGQGIALKGYYDTLSQLEAAHPTGVAGDAYIVGKNLYVWDTIDNQWQDTGESVGPQGPKGDQGDPGIRGPEGPEGPEGPRGNDGPEGPKGQEGEVGPQGDKGDKGDQGEKGDIGPQGPKGDPGAGIDTATAPLVVTGNDVSLDKAALFTSPALTGVPTAPSPAVGTNTTQVATAAMVTGAVAPKAATTYVDAGLAKKADLTAATFTGTVNVVSPSGPTGSGVRQIFISTVAPTGTDGEDGDIWITYTP